MTKKKYFVYLFRFILFTAITAVDLVYLLLLPGLSPVTARSSCRLSPAGAPLMESSSQHMYGGFDWHAHRIVCHFFEALCVI